MRFHQRFEPHAARDAIVEVGGCSNGELVAPIGPAGDVAGRTVFQVARQPGDDRHPDTISLWDVSGTRLVRVPRNLPVNVCDDVVVAYTVRRETGLVPRRSSRAARHSDLVAHDPLEPPT